MGRKKELLQSSVRAAVYLAPDTVYKRWEQGHAVSVPGTVGRAGVGVPPGGPGCAVETCTVGRQAPAEPMGGDWELGRTTLEQP